MGNKNPEIVEIGDWYSMCCILDLYQINDDDYLKYVQGMLQDALDDKDDDWGMHTWKTLKKAIDEICSEDGWGDDINERPDLKLLLESDIENKENF